MDKKLISKSEESPEFGKATERLTLTMGSNFTELLAELMNFTDLSRVFLKNASYKNNLDQDFDSVQSYIY
ncbi:hypothetical protein [Acinetobacter bouvetii]|uniref:Uncharacterized protein n=1 Tax=Acinetobacter bouvetii TaxID=202951 RepID=A0A811G9M5_9GAMM|nr:hypothetical protein [Acinetobacter bouvetii]CAB1211108.1 hypothetical protein SFB21_0900 [Acinetobacter bouvetii]